ncbi:hypothetical protein H0I23_01380 [Cellulophaga sp. HaHaR_3_176]|uniref:hypothetical protein n=1 Tax=Cellulophaga sp. HaHaR_3_176 TaxID=1942464 RepID=UPI001C1F80B3|nr:hypothetical protein [Cellulophaga sp. HaHaR_3_176]QWX84334.1 hypothetical protein H0I23_01380 [Cellulophaga sp. HaHaR_3_176]
MFKFIIKSCFIILFATSCNSSKTEVSFLVTSNYLKDLDSIKKQTPYNSLNKGWNQAYSNLPIKLREKRDNRKTIYNAWDEIVEKYKIESNVEIDTISKSEIRIRRNLTKWVYDNGKRVNKRLSLAEFKKLLSNEGIQPSSYKILFESEQLWSGGLKSTFLELYYKGTVNKIRIDEKGTISNTTFLISQIPYWKSTGHQFPTKE